MAFTPAVPKAAVNLRKVGTRLERATLAFTPAVPCLAVGLRKVRWG